MLFYLMRVCLHVCKYMHVYVCVCTILCSFVCGNVCVLFSRNIIITFSKGVYRTVTTGHKESFSSKCLMKHTIINLHIDDLTLAGMLSHQTTAVSSDNMAPVLQTSRNISVPAKVSTFESPG